MNLKGAAAMLLTCLLACAPAYGRADADWLPAAATLDELMSMPASIATYSPQPVSRAPAAVTVVTADDIRATGATNLVEVLQSVPGIYLRISQFGFRPMISMRGAATKNTLLMIDGIPQRDLVWAIGMLWRGLPTSMIERIEIVRGPASALYGSDAASGVINVVTLVAGRIDKPEAGVRLGSFDTQSTWLQHGAQWNGLDVSFTLDAMHTDGSRPWARARDNTAGHAENGYDNLDLRLAVGRDNWRVMADHMQKRNVAIGFVGGGFLDPVTRAHDRQTSLAWLYQNDDWRQDWELDAEIRYRELAYSSGNGFWEVPASPANLNRMRLAERRASGEASAAYRGRAGHTLRFGIGYVWQDLHDVSQMVGGMPATFAPEKSRRNLYLFAQDVWQAGESLELTAGIRYDHYSEVGGALSPRLAAVWTPNQRWVGKLMVGRAFRAPSFLEMFATTGATLPNPALAAERSETWEAALSWRATRDLSLGANLFRYRQANPIVAVGAFPQKFGNVDPHTIRGIEMEVVWQATRTLRLAANATVRGADDEQFRRLGVQDHFAIPDQDAYLRADWAFLPKWRWNVQANWTGKRKLGGGDTRRPPGRRTVVDTTLRYFHGSEWEFAASLRNLFDADAREYAGTRIPDYLPMPRRSAFVEARFKF